MKLPNNLIYIARQTLGVSIGGVPYYIICDLTLTVNGKNAVREDQTLVLNMDSSSSPNVAEIDGHDPYWFSEFKLQYMKNISFDGKIIDLDGDARGERPYGKYHLSISNIRKA